MSTLPLELFAHWLAYGERGMSSESIMRAATGGRPGRWGWIEPADPADFRRCQLLLAEVPAVRDAAFPRLAAESRVWAALIEHWNQIADVFAHEAPGYLESRRWSAPQTYQLMRRIIDTARKETT